MIFYLHQSLETQHLCRRYIALREFISYRQQNYLDGQFPPTWWNLYDHDSDLKSSQEPPTNLNVAKVGLVMPLHTSDVERAFNVQNQIKTAIRKRISSDFVNKHLLVGIEGPHIAEFSWQESANKWRKEKTRKLFR